ncbi:protein kinase domain-containing protein [Paludibaculum fermentans]|uniref:protein kinase domain-containing protein n=1 Tax=Paludibaculum fermentans TaxID=1473598 RepID=UPI003EB7A078
MMGPDNWKRVEELFNEAVELPKAERARWLDEQCAGDAELRTEVLALLDSDEAAQGFVEQEVAGAVLELHSRRAAPETRRIGPYRLVRELGRGGMGTVYLAERADDQYQGEVAIKLVRQGMDTEFFLARFRRERQTLARLQHPNIARLLDSGTTDEGLPFIVMERVDGVPINTYCEEHKLGVDALLRLYLQVCAAVAHAHQNLVVHRDLKPGNILVDRTGTPKLLDFGICKLLLHEPGEGETVTGAAMMTPDYASPEQVRGEPITVASDIYSLGAVMFELLTGTRPHLIEKYSPQMLERAICEEEIRRPSTLVSDKTRARQLAGDLDTIIGRAMQKEPSRRYHSVEQFGNDIRRHLDNRPITARPDTVTYRARKFVLRNRGVLAAGFAVAAALTGGVIVSAHEAAVARQRFGQTRKLANALIFDVYDRVKPLPGSLPAREAIVRTGMEYLDNLSASARDDGDLRVELAGAYERMGEVQGNILGSHNGDTTGAQASFRKALSTLEGLPNNGAAGQARLRIYQRLGNLESYTGHKAEALRVYQEAVKIGDELARSGLNNQARRSLAGIYDSISRVYRENGKSQESLESEKQALGLLEDALNANPGDRGLQASVAASNAGYGMALAGVNQLEAAVRKFQVSADAWEKICQAEPTNIDHQRQRMLAYSHLGDVKGNPNYPNLGDKAGALAAFRKMMEIAGSLHESNPSDQGSLFDYGMATMRTAALPAQSAEEQVVLFRKAAGLLEQASKNSPANINIVVNLAALHEQLGDVLLGAGRTKEADQEFLVSHQLAGKHLGEMLPYYRIYITTGRKLAESAAGRGESETALQYANQAVTVAEKLSTAKGAGVPQRALAPRAYSGLASTYEKLHRAADARRWREKALAQFQELQDKPGFTRYHKDEMLRVEKALKGK